MKLLFRNFSFSSWNWLQLRRLQVCKYAQCTCRCLNGKGVVSIRLGRKLLKHPWSYKTILLTLILDIDLSILTSSEVITISLSARDFRLCPIQEQGSYFICHDLNSHQDLAPSGASYTTFIAQWLVQNFQSQFHARVFIAHNYKVQTYDHNKIDDFVTLAVRKQWILNF